MEIIYPFRLSKDMLLFNIMNTHLHIFNFVIIVLQMGVVYTLLYKVKVLQYLENGILSSHSWVSLQ